MSAPPGDLLARHRGIARQRAAAEARHPDITLLVERSEMAGWLHAAVALIDHLTCERDAALAGEAAAWREVKALRWTNGARERTIQRQLETIRDLRRKLPRWENGDLTAAEAFNCTHSIVDVIGGVVELQERENGYRRYLSGRCPFCHNESLVVRPYSGEFACYGNLCGIGGTAADFVRALRRKENNSQNGEAS